MAKTKAAAKKTVRKKATPKKKVQAAQNGFAPRLKELYRNEVLPALMKEFGIASVMSAPRLEKIVLNMGLGEASRNIKILDSALLELAALAGQQPTITRARKSIAAFKLREGMPVGCRVTLRRDLMWEFLDRLISVALPRVRDFRGLSRRSFDGRGDYTLGLDDHLIFPEVDYSKNEGSKGLNVSVVTTADDDQRALFLLRGLGMPFARETEKADSE